MPHFYADSVLQWPALRFFEILQVFLAFIMYLRYMVWLASHPQFMRSPNLSVLCEWYPQEDLKQQKPNEAQTKVHLKQ